MAFDVWPHQRRCVRRERVGHLLECAGDAGAIESGAIDVAESADGGILAVTHVEELNTRDLVMWKLYVLPDRQRLGIGRALVGAAKARARVHGGDLVTEFAATNERVRPLRPGGRPLRR